MKVLHVVPTLDPRAGGPGVAVRGMARHLTGRGVEMTVASTTTGPAWHIDGVTTVQFPVAWFRALPVLFSYSPGLARWLEARSREFDLVHVHTIFNFPTTTACRIARRHGVPYVISACGTLNPWSLAQGRLRKSVWLRTVERANLLRAAAYHATSEEERLAIARLAPEASCAVIPLGVDCPPARQAAPAGGRKRVLFLSRLSPKKGLERLIEALAALRVRDDFSFLIAGSGEPAYERRLRRLVTAAGLDPITQWCGFVAGEEKDALFRSADIFVLDSDDENFGIAVAEAMGHGIPVVISDRIHMHRLASANAAGIVVGREGETLAQAIERLLEDTALRTRCGANAAAVAARSFSWERIAPQLVDLYARCIKDGSRAGGQR